MTPQQIKNILYGAVIGDALGVPVEFEPRDTYYVDHMTDGGTWQQPVGT